MARSLGSLRQSFRPGLLRVGASLFAAVTLGICLPLLGAAGVYELESNPDTPNVTKEAYIAITACLFAAPVVGVTHALAYFRLLHHRVRVYENGFAFDYGRMRYVTYWEDLSKIHEVTNRQKTLSESIDTPTLAFFVQRNDFKEFQFSERSLDKLPMLRVYLRAAHVDHQIPWHTLELPPRSWWTVCMEAAWSLVQKRSRFRPPDRDLIAQESASDDESVE